MWQTEQVSPILLHSFDFVGRIWFVVTMTQAIYILVVCVVLILESMSVIITRNTHAQSMPRAEEHLEICK